MDPEKLKKLQAAAANNRIGESRPNATQGVTRAGNGELTIGV